MRFSIIKWPLLFLYKNRNRINFPVYQRGLVWDEGKKKLLVDSIFKGIDIPKLYMQKTDDGWDCIDGHQRIQAIIGYFDGEFEDLEHQATFESLSFEDRCKFEEYELTITEIEEINDEEVRLLFTRLQLGVPLNAGEKLNAIQSNLGTFVTLMTQHPFIKLVSVPERRFAKEQICAQICNNSSYLNKTGQFRTSRYEDLENLYRAYSGFALRSSEARSIINILDKLNIIFGSEATQITNRASVVSIYLFVEELFKNGELDGSEPAVKGFYLAFLESVKNEAKLGIDATSHLLVGYQSRIIQAADSKSSITFRHEKLKEFYNNYLINEEIMR